ncbi:MAG: hypothetical protein SGBAC_011598, partial [Bacillariaceae sp.]
MKFAYVDTVLAVMLIGSTEAFAPANNKKTAMLHPSKTTTTTSRTKPSLNMEALEPLEQKTPDYDATTKLLDSYAEQSRQYRRNVFGSADWVKSRRSTRFFDTILSTPQSGLVRQISTQVLFISAAAAFVIVYNGMFVDGYTDFVGVKHEALSQSLPAFKLPMVPFTLSSGALGLLLTFRTNVSYARWNEARTAWGKVINDSRSIARMGCI